MRWKLVFAVALLPCGFGNLLYVLAIVSDANLFYVKDPQQEAAFKSASDLCFDRALAQHDQAALNKCVEEYVAHTYDRGNPRATPWIIAGAILLAAGTLPGLLIGALVRDNRFGHEIHASVLGWGLGTIAFLLIFTLTLPPDPPPQAGQGEGMLWAALLIFAAPPLTLLSGACSVLARRLRDRLLDRRSAAEQV